MIVNRLPGTGTRGSGTAATADPCRSGAGHSPEQPGQSGTGASRMPYQRSTLTVLTL
jgi:hypothetical protein